MRRLYEAFSRSSRINKGFTLIELLVVVAIIAILAAIAIPQFTKYRKNAAAATIQSDARNCLTDAIAQITQAEISGQTVPTSGTYTNVSPFTDPNGCTWTYDPANQVISCTCNGETGTIAAGISCTAQQTPTGSSVTCTGL